MAKMASSEKFFVNSPVQRYFHRIFGFGRFLHRLPVVSYENILEIGCAVGFTTTLLAKKYPNANITATDFDEELIAIAKTKQHSDNVNFQQADATRLSFPNEVFDAAFAVLVLHHIENFPAAVAELSRVVKPGGSVYIMDIPSKSFNFIHFRKQGVQGLFDKADLIHFMQRSGLTVTDHGGRFLFALEGRKE